MRRPAIGFSPSERHRQAEGSDSHPGERSPAFALLRPVASFDAEKSARPSPCRSSHGKTPLFASARDASVERLALPELSMSTGALWPGRDAGAEVHLAGPSLPVEAWARVGNGSGGPFGNDNPNPSFDAELVFGRARDGAERATTRT